LEPAQRLLGPAQSAADCRSTAAVRPLDSLIVRLNDQLTELKTIRFRESTMGTKPDHGWSWWYLLLLVQFVPALWVPYYNSAEPSWIGLPFFYWFQLALVFICAAVTAVVYFITEWSQQR
jgi:hypothetical protein